MGIITRLVYHLTMHFVGKHSDEPDYIFIIYIISMYIWAILGNEFVLSNFCQDHVCIFVWKLITNNHINSYTFYMVMLIILKNFWNIYRETLIQKTSMPEHRAHVDICESRMKWKVYIYSWVCISHLRLCIYYLWESFITWTYEICLFPFQVGH